MLFSNKSKCLIVLLVTWLGSCKVHTVGLEAVATTKSDRIGIEGSKFRGTLFRKEYDIVSTRSIYRFTPTIEEIEKVEKLLRQQIKSINEKRTNQGSNCPVIHKHIQDYFRQYVGLIDSNNNKVVHINFLWDRADRISPFKKKKDSTLDYETDYQTMYDGCSHYWIISINLVTEKVIQFSVNGPA